MLPDSRCRRSLCPRALVCADVRLLEGQGRDCWPGSMLCQGLRMLSWRRFAVEEVVAAKHFLQALASFL